MRQLRVLVLSKPSSAIAEKQLTEFWSTWKQDKLSLYRTSDSRLSEVVLGPYEQLVCERLFKKADGAEWSEAQKIWKDEFAVVICEGTSTALFENFKYQDTVLVDSFDKAEAYLKKLSLQP
ncbi:hypothetical protein [Pseudobdellovibrio exovorus]|uniref:Uncharacterized protein n=1 Tax=Pseudobdellovibrio exovorus JSS TaxID=1184267 RepID=M4VBN2_9BACT|nr:hypothetical protein [Pseudobdellovibrio exovorus]AGH96807.1 hypothetical protein A11Q_2591 [Pseudobdellovibrio exovorus JSS]